MFHGSMVALVTPMQEGGELNFDELHQLVEFHVANGTNAIVVAGTTGESPTLSEKEHCELIRRMVEMAAGRVPVIAGTGSNSTREAIDLTQCAMEGGADACLLVVPYYNNPAQEGLYQHFKTIAEAVAIPQILYNVPGRTICDILPETVERLSHISNIIGIKEATGDLQRAQEIMERCGERLDVYSGDDATAMELMLCGGKGVISVTANLMPKSMHEMCAAALRGDRVSAQVINDRLTPLHRDLYIEANPIPVKWALHEMALISTGIRLPLTKLSSQYHEMVRRALQDSGAL